MTSDDQDLSEGAGRPTMAVLGFRPHTYWTAVVALAGPSDAPQVIERRKIQFAVGDERFVFHQAAEAPAGAPALLEQVRAATCANALREIAALVADLQLTGLAVRIAVTAAATAKLPPRLADVLASHSRIHAAEGSFYRDVVASACEAAGLEVRRPVERDLARLVAARLGLDEAALDARLKAMGAALGPPWSEDQKLAALAAWTGLESA
jgi:hypothetical protein